MLITKIYRLVKANKALFKNHLTDSVCSEHVHIALGTSLHDPKLYPNASIWATLKFYFLFIRKLRLWMQ